MVDDDVRIAVLPIEQLHPELMVNGRRVRCAICGKACWVSNNTPHHDDPKARFECFFCLDPVTAMAALQFPTEEQMASIREVFPEATGEEVVEMVVKFLHFRSNLKRIREGRRMHDA